MAKVRLPTALLKEIRHVRDQAKPELYKLLCDTIIALDAANVLNDQIMVSSADDGDICLQWTYNIFYDIFYDGEPPSIQFMVARYKGNTDDRKSGSEPLLSTLIEWLKEMVDTTDPYDPYQKDKRTLENSEEVISPF
jgi:hypothetical protein